MELGRSSQKVVAALEATYLSVRVEELPDSTRTAKEATVALRCDAAQIVESRTGFAIGSVPLPGHTEPIGTVADRRLLGHETVWAAAGTPRAVSRATPDALCHVTGAEVVHVAAGSAA